MDEETYAVELSLEETGWLCHYLMQELGPRITGEKPLSGDPLEKAVFVRKMALYEKLSRANDSLMGKAQGGRKD